MSNSTDTYIKITPKRKKVVAQVGDVALTATIYRVGQANAHEIDSIRVTQKGIPLSAGRFNVFVAKIKKGWNDIKIAFRRRR